LKPETAQKKGDSGVIERKGWLHCRIIKKRENSRGVLDIKKRGGRFGNRTSSDAAGGRPLRCERKPGGGRKYSSLFLYRPRKKKRGRQVAERKEEQNVDPNSDRRRGGQDGKVSWCVKKKVLSIKMKKPSGKKKGITQRI